jgi:ABC-2 type transport system permease protein
MNLCENLFSVGEFLVDKRIGIFRGEKMYFAIFIKNLRQQLTYRSEFLIGIIGNILYVYVEVCIWKALLATGMGGDITLAQMVTYVIISFTLRGITRSELSITLANKVKTGNIAIDFIRPIKLKWYLFADQMSQNCFSALVGVIPAFVISIFVWGFLPPTYTANLVLFFVSGIFSVLIMFYLEYIIGLFVFWVKNGDYTDFILSGLFTVFSGATIPLWFYPNWLASVCNVLPFKLVVFEPIQIYLGKVTVLGALNIILLQIIRLILLIVLEKIVWWRAQNLCLGLRICYYYRCVIKGAFDKTSSLLYNPQL